MLLVFVYALTYVILLVCFVAAFFIAGSFIALLVVGVPFASTPERNIEKALNLLELKPGDTLYDLGCGDGRALLAAERRGAKAIGYEISPWPYLKAQYNLFKAKSKAKIFLKNFYQVNISDADAVFCFLLNRVMDRVEKKLSSELKPGTKVVSYGFPFTTRKPSSTIDTNPENPNASKIYLYIM